MRTNNLYNIKWLSVTLSIIFLTFAIISCIEDDGESTNGGDIPESGDETSTDVVIDVPGDSEGPWPRYGIIYYQPSLDDGVTTDVLIRAYTKADHDTSGLWTGSIEVTGMFGVNTSPIYMLGTFDFHWTQIPNSDNVQAVIVAQLSGWLQPFANDREFLIWLDQEAFISFEHNPNSHEVHITVHPGDGRQYILPWVDEIFSGFVGFDGITQIHTYSKEDMEPDIGFIEE